MSLGAKLQAAHAKVAGKLGQQEGSVVFRKRAHVSGAAFGAAYASNSYTDVTITSGVRVSRVTSHNVDRGGLWQVNDLRLYVPGSLLSEAQLTGAEVVYGGRVHGIVSAAPTEIISGVPVLWDIVCRVQP